ncbi:helix-turn-helix domain-containing protein [Eggerthella sinensis]|uniref:PucR family transcriptional regulator n=1 Tax=Eggerthella sinensis TaxID=242230 RepID=UPI00266D3C70|nr:PucR family transcriptional regulator [Eggerthella sinensis]
MSNLSIKSEALLLPLVYRNASTQELIDAAATLVGTPLRFSPENDVERSFVSPRYPVQDIELVRAALASDDRGFNTFIGVLNAAEDRDKPIIYRAEDGTYTKIFCNIAIGSRYFGNLSIPRAEIPLETIDLDVVQTVAQMIALHSAVHGVWGYDCSEGNLLKALLLGVVQTGTQLALRARDPQYYRDKVWRLVQAGHSSVASDAMLLSGLSRIFPGSPAVIMDDGINMLVGSCDRALDAKGEEKLRTLAVNFDTMIMVGMPFDDVLNCSAMHAAMRAFPQAKNPQPGTVVLCDRCKEYYLFGFSGLSALELRNYCEPKLLAVRDYDEEHGSSYFDTLRAYLDAGKNVAAAAQALSVHTNTVNYRVNRIREAFGIDATDAQTSFELMLSFKVLDFIA